MEKSKALSRAGWIGLGVLLLGLLTLGIVFLIYRQQQKKKGIATSSDPVTERKEKPSSDGQRETFMQIKDFIINLGFSEEFAATLAAVSCHETGRWASDLANNFNNLFGMKSGGSGKGIQVEEEKGFAVYNNWDDSITDVAEWFKAKGYPVDEEMSSENILQWMKSKKYFEDSLANYKKAVLSLKNEFNN